MDKKERQKKKERDEFEQYVKMSTDEQFTTMLEIAEMQKTHKDYLNICWAGSPHNIPMIDVLQILDTEKKRRGLNEQRTDTRKTP